MNHNRIFKFKLAWKTFLDATAYMAKRRLSIKDPNDPLWQEAIAKFEKDILEPIDRMYSKMTQEEQSEFRSQIGMK